MSPTYWYLLCLASISILPYKVNDTDLNEFYFPGEYFQPVMSGMEKESYSAVRYILHNASYIIYLEDNQTSPYFAFKLDEEYPDLHTLHITLFFYRLLKLFLETSYLSTWITIMISLIS